MFFCQKAHRSLLIAHFSKCSSVKTLIAHCSPLTAQKNSPSKEGGACKLPNYCCPVKLKTA
jgi:hypothetical protein